MSEQAGARPSASHGNAMWATMMRTPGDGGPRHGRLRMTIEAEIPSDVGCIEWIVELIQAQCRELSFPAWQCSLNVPVALTEALSNAILRGNREDPTKHVRVRSEIDGDRLVIDVKDEGGGFDLQQSLRDPTRPENILREDGRGLFLMTRLMSRIERFTDGGNVVRLTLDRHE